MVISAGVSRSFAADVDIQFSLDNRKSFDESQMIVNWRTGPARGQTDLVQLAGAVGFLFADQHGDCFAGYGVADGLALAHRGPVVRYARAGIGYVESAVLSLIW